MGPLKCFGLGNLKFSGLGCGFCVNSVNQKKILQQRKIQGGLGTWRSGEAKEFILGLGAGKQWIKEVEEKG